MDTARHYDGGQAASGILRRQLHTKSGCLKNVQIKAMDFMCLTSQLIRSNFKIELFIKNTNDLISILFYMSV